MIGGLRGNERLEMEVVSSVKDRESSAKERVSSAKGERVAPKGE